MKPITFVGPSGEVSLASYNSDTVTALPSQPPVSEIELLPVPGELIIPRVVVPPPPPPPPPVGVPASWLVGQGSASVVWRLYREVLQHAPEASTWPLVPYGSRAGWHLLGLQDGDGTWSGGMLAAPAGGEVIGVGTIPAYRRLLELGWDPEQPALAHTKRLLFRLLAQDDDPTVLAELRPAGDDEDLVLRGRLLLREAAAAALAQAGYEADPRLRGAARRLIDRVGAFLRSPLGQKPWLRLGNQHVLAADAAPPSFHLLLMLAFMPQFRSEHSEFMERLEAYLAVPWPRQAVVQQVGAHIVEQPHLVLGDFLATRGDLDGDMPSALAWLEVMARLGFLGRHEGWARLLERTLDDRDRRHVWHPPRSMAMPAVVPAWSWPLLPLSDPAIVGAEAALCIDVTFRLALIARLTGRVLEFS